MSKSEPRKKRQSVELVDETHDTKLFITQRTFGREIIKKHYIVLKREPQFTLESRNGRGFEFIRLTRNNKLVGRLKNGLLERRDDVDKVFFLSKLDLVPKSPPLETPPTSLISESSSVDGDHYQSSTSPSSPLSEE